MFRIHILHLMVFIAVLAPFLLCATIMFETGSGSDLRLRKMIAFFFLLIATIVASCFAVAYLKDSPEEWKRRFSSERLNPEQAQDRAEVETHWRWLVAIMRSIFRG
jgi:hypothetical protein